MFSRIMVKVNVGCGRDYREGWLNADINRGVKADIYLDMGEGLPFRDNMVGRIMLDNVLEHVPRDRYFGFLEELHRVCAPGAEIEVYAPHYSGMFAFKHPAHYVYFGIGSFDLFDDEAPFNGERYINARFRVRDQRLLFFHHNLVTHPWLSKLPINWLFNWAPVWQLLMERFQFCGFDEIYYRLEVLK
ncbi:MAG: hypothetical protein U9Q79_06965 [Candidatus Hydrogenedentes bacterium]|nr:hypothetical protein [Candidatus Hydrogenedentota bacterium]